MSLVWNERVILAPFIALPFISNFHSSGIATKLQQKRDTNQFPHLSNPSMRRTWKQQKENQQILSEHEHNETPFSA